MFKKVQRKWPQLSFFAATVLSAPTVQARSYNLQALSYELQVTSYKIRDASYELRDTRYKMAPAAADDSTVQHLDHGMIVPCRPALYNERLRWLSELCSG
jgi:hypothetical protein